MSQELMILLSTAAFIGFFHTLLGPDHYLPLKRMERFTYTLAGGSICLC